jgi:hypothetical protein
VVRVLGVEGAVEADECGLAGVGERLGARVVLRGLRIGTIHVAVSLFVAGGGWPRPVCESPAGASCLGSADCLLCTVGGTYSAWQAPRRMKGPK